MARAIVNEDATTPAQTLALQALGWTLAEPERAGRLLSVTGIEPADLRRRLNDPVVLAATLNFLLAHEPDLLACADSLRVPPAAIADAAHRLEAA